MSNMDLTLTFTGGKKVIKGEFMTTKEDFIKTQVLCQRPRFAHLGGFLQMASVVFLDVVPGADGGFQLVSHHHARALGGRPSDEQHHTSSCVGECSLRIKRGGIGFRLSLSIIEQHLCSSYNPTPQACYLTISRSSYKQAFAR